MSKKKTNLAACGAVREDSGQYRAHFNFRNAEGRQENIVGPKRTEHALAKEDLAAIRAYGALFGDDCEGGLRAMRAEARRIQERVAFEHEIRAAMERQREEMTEDANCWRRVVAIASRRRGARTLRPRIHPFQHLHTTPSQPLDACVYADDRTTARAWTPPLLQS